MVFVEVTSAPCRMRDLCRECHAFREDGLNNRVRDRFACIRQPIQGTSTFICRERFP